jgi:hypothetical protein
MNNNQKNLKINLGFLNKGHKNGGLYNNEDNLVISN